MNYFDEMHQAVEAPIMNWKAVIRSAIKFLIRRSDTHEIHGSPWDLSEKILLEMGSTAFPERIKIFREDHLCPWHIEEIVEGSDLEFIYQRHQGLFHIVEKSAMVE